MSSCRPSASSVVPAKDFRLVDDVSECQRVCVSIMENPPTPSATGGKAAIVVDLEGVNLSRTGPISIVSVATNDCVFLFDITVMRDAAFSAGLGDLLEAQNIIKVLFDCRNDCDSLFAQYQVKVGPVCDLQPMGMKALLPPSRMQYLMGLAKVFDKLNLFTLEDMRLKEQCGQLTFKSKEGNPEMWAERPLDSVLLRYSAMDVKYCFKALDMLKEHFEYGCTVGEWRRDSVIFSSEMVPRLAETDFLGCKSKK